MASIRSASVGACACARTLAQGIKVAFPTDPAEGTGLVERHRFRRQRPQREVDRLALGGKPIAPHHFCARPIVDIYVCTRHTPTMHQYGRDKQAVDARGFGRVAKSTTTATYAIAPLIATLFTYVVPVEGGQVPSPLRGEGEDEGETPSQTPRTRQGTERNGTKWNRIKSLPLLATRNEATTIETRPRWPTAYE